MVKNTTFSPDAPLYFPDLGEWAQPGDTVTVNADGVVRGIEPKADPKAQKKTSSTDAPASDATKES